MVEQPHCKRQAVGSNPTISAKSHHIGGGVEGHASDMWQAGGKPLPYAESNNSPLSWTQNQAWDAYVIALNGTEQT